MTPPRSSDGRGRQARLWAQTALRSFAAATNLLIPGRRFLITGDIGAERALALVDLLDRFGALVAPTAPDGLAPTPGPGPHVVIVAGADRPAGGPAPLLDRARAAAPGAVLVDAPATGRARVLDPDGRPLTGPHRPGNGPDYGPRRIDWARTRMPVTARAVAGLAEDGLLAGRSIGLALVLEPKTAALALMLHEAGARVAVFGHADETREDVAEALRARGLTVFAQADATPEREEELARGFLAEGLEILLDDGSHLIRMAHDPVRAPRALDRMIGAAEETTSGLRPLRGFDLRVPVIASNDARSKTLFDNAYGTGQSCLLTVLDLLDPDGTGVDLAGRRVGVIGYGDVGTGFARFARACGAAVRVVDLDPVRELRARMDGHETSGIAEAAADCDWLVSATGERSTIRVEDLEAMHPGGVIAVAGGVFGEVEVDEALARGWTIADDPDRRAVHVLAPPGASPEEGLLLMDRGGCVNCTAGEGNPIEIMDMSFGVQTAALRELLTRGTGLAPGLHALPADADALVASRALDALR
ncbi:adenosylhomocysteinase [Actinomyces sp. B33]|uniref:adenosylhomocysteinase n=1 Tax=Actinomyces sp. B33 TaxID=2942131 RepID=UPI002340AF67|nr:adenosylhomocysteinase [Actinomyces sp. B33]MDC4233959.1 adenosylhomocysteinase [Actinomyces sp. B33]